MNHFGGFNPYNHGSFANGMNNMSMGGVFQHPLQTCTNEQLLQQLQAMASYADLNPGSMMLLGEVFRRAQESFGKTFAPTKAVYGDKYLYTSIYKNGVMTHFFVDDKETKQMVDDAIARTMDPTANVPGEYEWGARVSTLMSLGDVFTAVKVDENGKQLIEPYRCNFGTMVAAEGFAAQAQHPSKSLPMSVLEVNFGMMMATSSEYFVEQVVPMLFKVGMTEEQVAAVNLYLSVTDVAEEWKQSVDKDHFIPGGPGNPSSPVQIHLFPANEEAPIKILGGQTKQWTAGFVNRAVHPELFVGAYSANANATGYDPTGFGGKGSML